MEDHSLLKKKFSSPISYKRRRKSKYSFIVSFITNIMILLTPVCINSCLLQFAKKLIIDQKQNIIRRHVYLWTSKSLIQYCRKKVISTIKFKSKFLLVSKRLMQSYYKKIYFIQHWEYTFNLDCFFLDNFYFFYFWFFWGGFWDLRPY